MSNPILFKLRDLKPINDEPLVNKMLEILVAIPNEKQDDLWTRTQGAGNVCMFKHSITPGKVIEYVQGSKDDSVTTLYEGHPIFSSLKALTEARLDLISEIATVTMALPGTVVVRDAGRGRECFLRELGTAQLMDVLAEFTHTDLAAQ